ncbi:hypothetical protein MMC26_003638 [Xylographa opegraphella]|nr:hypothetical protein [Xylographa opegraphella]
MASSKYEYGLRITIINEHRKGSERLFKIPQDATLSNLALLLVGTFHTKAAHTSLRRTTLKVPIFVCGMICWPKIRIPNVMHDKQITLGDLVAAATPYGCSRIRIILDVREETDQQSAKIGHDLAFMGQVNDEAKKEEVTLLSGVDVDEDGTKVFTAEDQFTASPVLNLHLSHDREGTVA